MWGHEGFSEMSDTGKIGAESHCAAGSGAEWDQRCDFLDFFNLWNSPTPFAVILQIEELIPTDTIYFSIFETYSLVLSYFVAEIAFAFMMLWCIGFQFILSIGAQHPGNKDFIFVFILLWRWGMT